MGSPNNYKKFSAYEYKVLHIAPERIDFDKVYEVLGNLQVKINKTFYMVKSILWSGWVDKNNYVIIIEEPDKSIFPITFHVCERKWYNGEDRGKQHVRSAWNAWRRVVPPLLWRKVRGYLVVCVGNYTRSVRGSGCRTRMRVGKRFVRGGVFLYRVTFNWESHVLMNLKKMFKARLQGFVKKIDVKTATGAYKQIYEWLKDVNFAINITFSLT